MKNVLPNVFANSFVYIDEARANADRVSGVASYFAIRLMETSSRLNAHAKSRLPVSWREWAGVERDKQ